MQRTISLRTSDPYFRITSPDFKTTNVADYCKVVNGEGSRLSATGSRYAPPLAESVYLTEDIETCFAEKMFYFHREILEALDNLHVFPTMLLFLRQYVLWEVIFAHVVPDIFDLTFPGNLAPFQVLPSLVINPSRDYAHLKQKRAEIQAGHFNGLRAPSSRSKHHG